ncbi:NAD(P)/FAD-dependent oxidoreductase [Natrinema sp. 1APR25-10V2]|uniref:NAD(P)/FAD-dependent oxidoreductase n=1 Tax=Natrinema sp. 1APR25-10V2 TaxID=2951081 RepID=UPI002875AAD7|nr:NAD(P)/FAD-dependent oxidoreductase [Natrinema sp. 1APR25-10V2]MDS0475021.1 FAD-dependent monooxygenase [Natrinema sp. 1APR25-10V2]
MTLETVQPYDPDRLTERRGHTVVVGASVAGLLAARVLSDRFESVTLVEKDPLPDGAVSRPGVPQGNHIHAMQRAGQATLEDLFPGYSEDVADAGGLVLDFASDFEIYQKGGVLAAGPARIPQYNASRPIFEQIIRERVAGLDGVTILDECQFRGFLVDDQASTVEGVLVRTTRGEREIDAELVVDATGRTSRTPVWLETNGYPAPPLDEVSIDLAYSTVLLERPTDARRAFLVLPDAPRTRGAAVFPIENGRWLLTLAGMHGDHPPTDPEDIAEYAASLPVADVRRLFDEHALISEVGTRYPFPASVRRRYEDLDRFPDGLLVVGDAIASVNPIYGQGMSVAALEAVQLHHTLATADRDELARRFFERAARVVDDAWSLAVGSDFEFPQTTGPKPFGTDLANGYIARLLRRAHTDGRLTDAFVRVVVMENRPTSLFRPRIAWRVLKPGP